VIPYITQWMTPLEALDHARSYLWLSSMLGPSNNKPGYVISKISCNPMFAKKIAQLTSDMTRNERVEPRLRVLSWLDKEKRKYRDVPLPRGN
jgi:hypothetical protein